MSHHHIRLYVADLTFDNLAALHLTACNFYNMQGQIFLFRPFFSLLVGLLGVVLASGGVLDPDLVSRSQWSHERERRRVQYPVQVISRHLYYGK